MNSDQTPAETSITTAADDEAWLNAMLASSSHIFPMILHAAIELDLFEILARSAAGEDGNAWMSPSEIAARLPTANPDAAAMIDRIMRLLASRSLVKCSWRGVENGGVERVYGVAEAGKYLVRDENGGSFASLSPFALHSAVVEVWLHLKDAVLEGGNLFKKVHGKSLFQYMNGDPTLNRAFNKAMADLTVIHMKSILEKYKGFEGISTLIDVGGGTGESLNMIISKYPSLKGINFDLPQVIQTAPPYEGITHCGGDMFSSVPKGDAIMVKGTCHNWSDEHCLKFLKNCYEALPQNGKVIVVDMIMPELPDPSSASKYVSDLDNAMLIQQGGKERTEKEFEALCMGSGFSKFQVACLAHSVLGVMEFCK